MSRAIVVSFGCPRSGTTFVHVALRALEPDAVVVKLSETNGLHPAQSRDGLITLARLLRGHRLLLVRTVRDPAEIVESFLAARTPAGLAAGMDGLARNSDADVCRWVREESESWSAQRRLVQEERHAHFVEVRYEDLADPKARETLVADVAESIGSAGRAEVFLARLEEFGGRPTRNGRLSLGLARVSTDAERAYFARALRATSLREGYPK